MWSITKTEPTARLLRLEIGRVLAGFVGGLHRSVIKASGAEFLSLRPHQHSDAFHQIDWMASARLSDDGLNLVTRELAPERSIRVLILADESVTMCTPRRKAACAQSLVDLFALSAFESDDPVKVIGFNGTTGLVNSEWIQNEEGLNTFLCAMDHEVKRLGLRAPAKTLAALFDELKLENTLVVVITDVTRLSAFPLRDLRSIDAGEKNVRIVAVVLDEWSGFVPSDNLLVVRHPETGKMATMDMRRGGDMEQQVFEFHHRVEALKEAGRSLGMRVIPLVLSTPQPFREFARSWLRFEEV
jgi:uncharacterized protein (DUF58 family)